MSYNLFGGSDFDYSLNLAGGRRKSPRRSPRKSPRRGRGKAGDSAYVSGKAARLGLLKKPRLKFDPKLNTYVPKKCRARSGRNVFISWFAKNKKVSGPELMKAANVAWDKLSVAEKRKWESKAQAMGLKPAAHARQVPKRVQSKLRKSPTRKSPRRKSQNGKGRKQRGGFGFGLHGNNNNNNNENENMGNENVWEEDDEDTSADFLF